MRRLVFVRSAGIFNPGEMAGVGDDLARAYVHAGAAHYDDEPAAPEAEGDGEGTTDTADAGSGDGRRRKR